MFNNLCIIWLITMAYMAFSQPPKKLVAWLFPPRNFFILHILATLKTQDSKISIPASTIFFAARYGGFWQRPLAA